MCPRAIAGELSDKDIARSLHISLPTAGNHVEHILRKLDAHSKLEAVALAFRNGWTQPLPVSGELEAAPVER